MACAGLTWPVGLTWPLWSLLAWLGCVLAGHAQTVTVGPGSAHWLTEPIWPARPAPLMPVSHTIAPPTAVPPAALPAPAPVAAPATPPATADQPKLNANANANANALSDPKSSPPSMPALLPLPPTAKDDSPGKLQPEHAHLPKQQPTANSAQPPTGNPSPAPASKQVVALVVETIAPLGIGKGQPLTYEILLHNTSLANLHAVTVRDELPAGTTYLHSEPAARVEGNVLTWSFDELPAHSKHRLKVHLQPSDQLQPGSTLGGTATASFSVRASHSTRIDAPKLQVSMTAPASVVVGESLPFEITLHNLGSLPIPNVTLRDQLPSILEHPHGQEVEADIGPLAPGEKRTITLRTTAARAGVGTNQLLAMSEAGEQRVVCDVRVVEPGLQVRCEAVKPVSLRGHFGLTVEVANPGSAPTQNLQVQTVLPEGIAFVSATEGGVYDPVSRSVRWTLGTLAPGAQRVLALRVQAVAAGDWLCRTTAQADGGLAHSAETPVHIEGIAAMQMEVVDLTDPVPVGGETEYEIRLLNQGSSPCTGVRIVAHIPEGLSLQRVSGPTPHRLNEGTLSFEPLARLAARADVVYRVRVRGIAAGDQRFRVELTCDQLRRPVIKEESTHVYPDDLPQAGTP